MNDILIKHVYTYEGRMFAHRIKVEQHPSKDLYLKITEWIEENIRGTWTDFYNNGYYFVELELEEDAVAFKLRWT